MTFLCQHLLLQYHSQARISSQNHISPLWTIPLLPQTSKHPQFVCIVRRYKGHARLPRRGCWIERGGGVVILQKGDLLVVLWMKENIGGGGSVLSLRASPPQARRGKFNLSKWLCTTECTYSGCGEVLRLKILTWQDQDSTSLVKKWYWLRLTYDWV